ncbi:polysaccharide pyruvyl transferase family protein [Paraclostridium bifermentans]|uniref:polysaccharide pyruvyl transferase family protein n=1 Tax=Paraclostridium bifermentans TaxID=1490 RepID=UPI001C813E9D|nr:polysaccharide pyruvyl transferase family protein [Paraclostridium bifermentans]GIM33805.1 putative pyruvyl transferase EpsI [Paraclostridium bifermentans subsp. muricolitidis]
MSIKEITKNIFKIETGTASRIKNKINLVMSNRYSKKFKVYEGKKKAILTLTPTHGNLGDHAIAEASYRYIKESFKEYELIELDIFEVYKYAKPLRNIITEDDIVFTIGGGNMNNYYKIEEESRRFIIDTFKTAKIVSLPQTISFSNDNNGKIELEKTKKIYNSNKDLRIVARENKSFEIMKKEFTNCKIIKSPDMVLYLENLNSNLNNRKNIMICLRDDLEGFISKNKRTEIINSIEKKYKHIDVCDTVINKNVDKHTRGLELNKIWNKFSNSKVVITDRLHGMIFCVITKTPCIVLRTFDHKLTESYRWFKELNFIKFIEDHSIDNIISIINQLENIENIENTKYREEHFKKFRQLLDL